MKKMSKLARKLQESKSRKSKLLKENYSPKVAEANNLLKKFITKDAELSAKPATDLMGGFSKGVVFDTYFPNDIDTSKMDDDLLDGSIVYVLFHDDGDFYDEPAGWVIGVESPSVQVINHVSEAEAKEFFGIISPLLKNVNAKLIVDNKDTDRPFTELFDSEAKSEPKSDGRTKVIVSKLSEFSADDFGVSEDVYEDILDHDGDEGYIELNGEEFDKYGYYDVEMDDTYGIQDLSGYHIDIVQDNLKESKDLVAKLEADLKHLKKIGRGNSEEAEEIEDELGSLTAMLDDGKLVEDKNEGSGMKDLDSLLTESKKARGRFQKKRAIRGKRKLNESRKMSRREIRNTPSYTSAFDRASTEDQIEILKYEIEDGLINDALDPVDIERLEKKLKRLGGSLDESGVEFGMTKNLTESINRFLKENDEEEYFSDDPAQEDVFGKSGMDDSKRSGKEFQAKSVTPKVDPRQEEFLENVERLESVLFRFNGLAVVNDGELNVDRSDYDIPELSYHIEKAADSLSEILEVLGM